MVDFARTFKQSSRFQQQIEATLSRAAGSSGAAAFCCFILLTLNLSLRREARERKSKKEDWKERKRQQDNLEEGTEISPTAPAAFYSPQDQIRSSLFFLFPARSRSLTIYDDFTTARLLNYVCILDCTRGCGSHETEMHFSRNDEWKIRFYLSGNWGPFAISHRNGFPRERAKLVLFRERLKWKSALY